MASHYSHGNAVAAIVLGIVVTFVSVMGQSDKTKCGQCSKPPVGNTVSFVITEEISNVTNLSSCFQYNTNLLYVCKEQETHQFNPKIDQDKILIKCTGIGWMDRTNTVIKDSPVCVKRENHCQSLPSSNQSTIFQIHGQNISINDNDRVSSLNYTEGTIATYKCKNPKPNYSQELRCTQKNNSYSWETINHKVCEESPSKGDSTETPINLSNTAETAETYDFGSETQTNESPRSLKSNLTRDLLIGICSSLGFVLIAVLLGILYKNRARLGKRYNDSGNHARELPFTSMPEAENKSKGKFADGEENLVYANIIPIKVNQETIYAEVETGKIGKSRPTNIKLTIDDDQLHTTYAEIHHSVITPKDQRR